MKKNIITLIKKELLIILKDKRARMVLIMPILLQTIFFGYVVSFDINKVNFAVYDEDRTAMSQQFAADFDSSGIFHRKYNINNPQEMRDLIDTKKVSTILHIESNFEKNILNNSTANVQVIIDSRNSNMAAVISGYVAEIVARYNSIATVNIQSRTWYNPNMESRWNMVTGLIAALAMLQIILLSAMSIPREREQGTFDQLLVTPLSTTEILIGKAIPAIMIGFIQMTLVLLIARFWFGIIFQGSLISLYIGLFVFLLAIVGVGLTISAIADNMQQGILYSFIIIMPMMLLSGLITPIKTMPMILQYITMLNPLRHGLIIARHIYLEGATLDTLLQPLLILALIAAILLPTASKLFRKSL